MNDYARELSAAWKDAHAPRAPDAPTVVSTFAGGGGSSQGYRMAGYKVLLAVEWMRYPADCYRLNFPDTDVYEGDIYEGDIAKLTVDEVLERTKLKVGQLDVLDGSPPCQGFSTAGKRQLDDPRNQLFGEFVRLLRGLRPRAFVMENVSGMVKGKMALVFAEAMRELKASGYRVSCRLLDAKWFGVPQSRQRVIFIGIREDLGVEPSHPRAQTRPRTLAEALSLDIAEEMPAPPLSGKTLEIAKKLRPGMKGDDISQSYFSLNRLDPGATSPTIQKLGSFKGQPRSIYPTETRGLSIGEVKRIGSFPDEYRFVQRDRPRADWDDAWGVVGNSVPPLMMRAIARHVRSLIGK
jgi:DNA (cytosine-5)-methyltransferase 1